MQEMCFNKGVNWNDFESTKKRGRLITKEYYSKNGALRSKWVSKGAFTFTKNRNALSELIP